MADILVIKFLTILLFGIFVNFPIGNSQQIFIHGSRPYILLPGGEIPTDFPLETSSSEIFERSDLLEISSEEQDDDPISNEKDILIVIKNSTIPEEPSTFSAEKITQQLANVFKRRKTNLNAESSVEEFDSGIENISNIDENESKPSAFRFLWPFQVSITKTKGGDPYHHHHHHDDVWDSNTKFVGSKPEKIPAHGFDPDLDPEVQKIRIEMFKQKKRKKKWKKIIKHELKELAAIGITKAIAFLEFI